MSMIGFSEGAYRTAKRLYKSLTGFYVQVTLTNTAPVSVLKSTGYRVFDAEIVAVYDGDYGPMVVLNLTDTDGDNTVNGPGDAIALNIYDDIKEVEVY